MGAFETDFAELTPFLLRHGWLFPPKILGGELRGRCARLRTTPPVDEAERRRLERELSDVLVFRAFHPNYRAYYVWLAMQQPHASAFSHLVETAVLHFYRGDFLSCTHCLLTVVEGILRQHFAAHNPKHKGHLSFGALKRSLGEARPVRSYPEWHEMYRQALAEFLAAWLWKSTDQADRELSHSNRHYTLHGLCLDGRCRSALSDEECSAAFGPGSARNPSPGPSGGYRCVFMHYLPPYDSLSIRHISPRLRGRPSATRPGTPHPRPPWVLTKLRGAFSRIL